MLYNYGNLKVRTEDKGNVQDQCTEHLLSNILHFSSLYKVHICIYLALSISVRGNYETF